MAVEVRLCDEDREQFGGPEWWVFDLTPLNELKTERLTELEREMGMSIWQLRNVEIPRSTARAMKASCWLPRELSGDDELRFEWDDFDIWPLKVDSRPVGGGALPPASGSPEDSTGEDTSEIPISSKPSSAGSRSSKGSASSLPRSRKRGQA